MDRSDTVRARVATGLFELVAEWNGFGRALYASAAGVQAAPQQPDMATSIALMAQAYALTRLSAQMWHCKHTMHGRAGADHIK